MDPGSAARAPRGAPTLVALALFAGLACVLLWPALTSGERLGGKDWNAFLGQAAAEASTLLDSGEFPAWNPWRRGGQVSFAQPESMLLTPVTPLVLWLGAPLAFKALLVPLFVACGMGLFALARDLGLRGGAALLPGVVFVCASPLCFYVNGGLPNWLFGMASLPWLLLASRRAPRSHGWLLLGSCLFALILFAGSVHHFVFFPLVLACEAVARALRERSVRPLLASGALGLVGVALSLVRLVPLLELFSEFPRRLDASGRFMPLELMARSLLLPHPPEAVDRLHVSVQGGSVLYWVDCGAFVGPLVLLLAVVALVAAWRRAWPFVAIAVAFAWLAAGSSVQPSLWDALHHLPVYASMQAPERFMGYVVFALALLAGFGGERLLGWLTRNGTRFARGAAALLLIAVGAPLVWFDAPIARGAFPIEPPADVAPTTWRGPGRPDPRPPFEQARFSDLAQQWGGPLHEAVLRNRGNVTGQSDVPSLPAARAVGDLDYRGEAYLEQGRGKVEARFTPNRIAVTATLDGDDTLLINQTFFPGWREVASGRACEPRHGLIALPLAAGSHALELEFAPRSIPAGALLTFASLLGLLGFAIGRRRERQAEAAAAAAAAAGVPGVAPAPAPRRHLIHALLLHRPARPRFRSELLAVVLQALLVGGVMAWYVTREPGGASPPLVPWQERALAITLADGPQALQAVLDQAPVGAVVRLAAGDYAAATLRRGVTLVADPLGGARVRDLVVVGVAAGERVATIGVVFGSDGVALPDPAAPPEERGTLTLRDCAGSIVLQGVGQAGARDVAEGVAPRTRIERCPQVLLFDLPLGATELVDSTLHAARVRFGESHAAESGLAATRSTLVLNDSSCERITLRDGASVRDFERRRPPSARDLALDIDATSSYRELGDDRCSLHLTRTYGDGRAVLLVLRGPPGTKGTLVVARDVELKPLQGKNVGQLRAGKFDGRQILFPFELSSSGEQRITPPPAGDDALPGDGWFFQAFVADERDGAGLLWSAMDGGLLTPP